MMTINNIQKEKSKIFKKVKEKWFKLQRVFKAILSSKINKWKGLMKKNLIKLR